MIEFHRFRLWINREIMRKRPLLLSAFIGLTALSCSTIAYAKGNEKTMYGRYEQIRIPSFNEAILSAKLDTGAYTSSLHATNIVEFKKEDEEWIRFTTEIISSKNKKREPYIFEAPLVKISKIKQRIEEYEESEEDEENEENAQNNRSKDKSSHVLRPVIELEVCLGTQLKKIEVNLTDRSNLKYPMLIGSKALRSFDAVVDVSAKYLEKPRCKK